jgi:signal transduction histidine kinase
MQPAHDRIQPDPLLLQYQQFAQGLLETLQILNSDRDLHEILQHIVAQARDLLGAQACLLHQVDIEQDSVILQAHSGWPDELAHYTDRQRFSESNPDFQHLILSRETSYGNYPTLEAFNAAHQDSDPRERDAIERDRRVLAHYAASVAVPLIIKEQVYGSLVLYYTDSQEFTQEKVNVAATFSEQAALAIENARLHQAEQAQLAEAQQRQLVAESLRATLQLLNAHRPLQQILDHIVQQAKELLHAGACVLHKVDPATGQAVRQASCGWPVDLLTRLSGQYDSFGPGYRHAIETREPVYGNYPPLPERLQEIEQDPTLSEEIKRRRLIIRERFAGSLLIPLVIKDKIYGCLIFYYEEPQSFPSGQINLASMFAEQAAMAIENARLHQAEQARRLEAEQRRRVAEGLRDILAILNSKRPLPDILNYIVMQASHLLGSTACVLYHVNRRREQIEIEAGYGLPADFASLKWIPLYPGGAVQRMLDSEPYMIADIPRHVSQLIPDGDFSSVDPALRAWLKVLHENYTAYLGVPLIVNNEIYGCMGLYFVEAHEFTDEAVRLALAFSDQAALAIENAQLHKQIEETAAITERNRLARDLHDSVTQTLFSASLIAKVLPRLWQRDEAEGWKRLEELHHLTRGALAEMRTLLLELRPTALADTELDQLLRHLVEAAMGRAGIPIELSTVGTCAVDRETKIAIYRIAQEALNNIAKHADATQVEVVLDCTAEDVSLRITDDGIGFSTEEVTADHLGLRIMHERAQSIGATLQIESASAQGTRVVFVCPQGEEG